MVLNYSGDGCIIGRPEGEIKIEYYAEDLCGCPDYMILNLKILSLHKIQSRSKESIL